jgi:DNA-binding PadR family transcriptional regulator
MITRKYKPMLDQLDLTYTQYIVMMVLWEEKQVNEKFLCEALCLKSNTITPLLKKLEAKGYIEKTAREEKTASIENNINSMIIACSSEGSKRAQLRLLVNRKDIDNFKQDTTVLQWMKQKQLGNKENIIIY